MLSATDDPPGDPPRRCLSYCNEDGEFESGFPCPREGDTPPDAEWCCGSKYERFCCNNATADVSDEFNEPYTCSNWWMFECVLPFCAVKVKLFFCRTQLYAKSESSVTNMCNCCVIFGFAAGRWRC